ncbi:MAG: O-antigen ligase family protein [Maricaulaceae bacterium]
MSQAQSPRRARTWRTWVSRRYDLAWALLLVGTPYGIIAGGRPLNAVVGLAGLLALAPVKWWRVSLPTGLGLASVAFLAWVAVSLIWSPYDQARLLPAVFGLPVAAASLTVVAMRLRDGRRRLWREALRFSVLMSGVWLLIQALGALAFVTPWYNGSVTEAAALSSRLMGHASSAFLVLMWPIWAMSARNDADGWLVIGGLAVCAVAAAVAFDQSANAVALTVGASVYASARAAPRWTWRVLIVMIVALIVSAPWLFGPGLDDLRAFTAEGPIPTSWRQRLAMWDHVSGLIAQKPFFGWGLDASRTFEDTMVVDGVRSRAVLLHPHNAGLHLWLETGLLGVLAATLVIILLAARVDRTARPGQLAGACAAAAAGWTQYAVC